MKKNIVAQIAAQDQPKKTRFKRWDLLPKFLCLILAIIVWLLVVNLYGADKGGDILISELFS